MTHVIAGCEVSFPHQPYGTQLQFMQRVIQTLGLRTNALLEAPTGSGKTLSLLCSALGWQRKVKQEGGLSEASEASTARPRGQGLGPDPADHLSASKGGKEGGTSVQTTHAGVEKAGSLAPCKRPDKKCCKGDSCGESSSDQDESDEDVFKSGKEGKAGTSKDQKEGARPGDTCAEQEPPRKAPVPKIYYATRTHSQIAQVVRELKRTVYRPKMAVLASREHYCINRHVARAPNRDEECERLVTKGVEKESCAYYDNMQQMFGLQTTSLQVHDIEDLVQSGRDHRGCPYYVARYFNEHAELVFCPYSYLLDPVIRSAMSIELGGCILIFDEAHNIEDNCREAASLELELDLLVAVKELYEKCCLSGGREDLYGQVALALGNVTDWLKECADAHLKEAGYERLDRVWSGHQMQEQLVKAHLSSGDVDVLRDLYKAIREVEAKDKEKQNAQSTSSSTSDPPKVGGMALGTLQRLLTVLEMLYQGEGKQIRDYRLCIQKWVQRGPQPSGRGRRRGDDQTARKVVVQLCLWCLHPAVVFKRVAEAARSVILTSGTLTPMGSFASELGAEFAIQWGAPHVVDLSKQVWAGVLGHGPNGTPIEAVYTKTESFAFQDAVGNSVLEVCRRVPDGVLFFLPSYALLDKLRARWELTGIWEQINELKPVQCEPRGTGDHFDSMMFSYYNGVRKGTGGLLLAVCRGKVSEGLDFTDGFARAVMVLGIPYPYLKDTKVNLKKEYNSAGRTQGLLTGSEWYCQQAFRALNQAIGRCIRHRNDFGAIILLDNRFLKPENQKHLSRWFKAALKDARSDFSKSMGSLKEFFARLEADPPGGQAPPKAADLAVVLPRSALDEPVLGKGAPEAVEVDPSQFATKSQPTLKAMWSGARPPNPVTACKRQALNDPRGPPKKGSAGVDAPVQAVGQDNPARDSAHHFLELQGITPPSGDGILGVEGSWSPVLGQENAHPNPNPPGVSHPGMPYINPPHDSADHGRNGAGQAGAGCFPHDPAGTPQVGSGRGVQLHKGRRVPQRLLPLHDQWDTAGNPVSVAPDAGPAPAVFTPVPQPSGSAAVGNQHESVAAVDTTGGGITCDLRHPGGNNHAAGQRDAMLQQNPGTEHSSGAHSGPLVCGPGDHVNAAGQGDPRQQHSGPLHSYDAHHGPLGRHPGGIYNAAGQGDPRLQCYPGPHSSDARHGLLVSKLHSRGQHGAASSMLSRHEIQAWASPKVSTPLTPHMQMVQGAYGMAQAPVSQRPQALPQVMEAAQQEQAGGSGLHRLCRQSSCGAPSLQSMPGTSRPHGSMPSRLGHPRAEHQGADVHSGAVSCLQSDDGAGAGMVREQAQPWQDTVQSHENGAACAFGQLPMHQSGVSNAKRPAQFGSAVQHLPQKRRVSDEGRQTTGSSMRAELGTATPHTHTLHYLGNQHGYVPCPEVVPGSSDNMRQASSGVFAANPVSGLRNPSPRVGPVTPAPNAHEGPAASSGAPGARTSMALGMDGPAVGSYCRSMAGRALAIQRPVSRPLCEGTHASAGQVLSTGGPRPNEDWGKSCRPNRGQGNSCTSGQMPPMVQGQWGTPGQAPPMVQHNGTTPAGTAGVAKDLGFNHESGRQAALKLDPVLIRGWIPRDMDAAVAYLRRVHADKAEVQNLAQEFGASGILECFDMARENVEGGACLLEAVRTWHCQLPQGLQCIVDLHGSTPPGSPMVAAPLREIAAMRAGYAAELTVIYGAHVDLQRSTQQGSSYK